MSLAQARATLERAARVQELDPALQAELRAASGFLADLEPRLGGLVSFDGLATAPQEIKAELAAVASETQASAEKILDAAEAMLAAARNDAQGLPALVAREALVIVEACGFQDITGQRVSKASRIIRELELALTEVSAMGPFGSSPREETPDERRRRELILHGPALDGAKLTQDEIDSILSLD